MLTLISELSLPPKQERRSMAVSDLRPPRTNHVWLFSYALK